MAEVTEAELIDRVEQIAPAIAQRAAQSEADRKPHDDSIQELADAEVFSLFTPKRYGGHEFSLDTHARVIEIISSACMSTAWVSAFYLGHNFMAVKFGREMQEELWGERPFALIPITTNPPISAKAVDGGWEISGRSSFASGIMHGDWVGLTGAAEEQALWVYMMPKSDVRVHDVWQMSGMAGTGSNDVEVEGLFVPAHRSVPLAEFFEGKTAGTMLHENPLYHTPLLPFIYNECMCVFSGGLRGATDYFEEVVRRRVTSHARTVVKDQQHTHYLLGEAHMNVLTAEALVRDLARETMKCVNKGDWLMTDRLRLKTIAAFIPQHCRRSMSDMIAHAGTSNFHNDRPLQRYFRDLNTLASHAFWDRDTTMELYGRERLGLEPNHPLI